MLQATMDHRSSVESFLGILPKASQAGASLHELVLPYSAHLRVYHTEAAANAQKSLFFGRRAGFDLVPRGWTVERRLFRGRNPALVADSDTETGF